MVSNKWAKYLNEIVRADARRSRAIDRRHNGLVQHIHVEMHPEVLFRHLLERIADARADDSRTNCQRLEYVDPSDGGVVHVRPGEVSVPVFALAELDNLSIHNERACNTRPFGREGFATSSGQSEVHACHGTQAMLGVIIARMAEVAVPIDMDE